MKSGMYIGGKAVADFEQEFAKYIGVKHAISVNSGTDSLVIALKALGIRGGSLPRQMSSITISMDFHERFSGVSKWTLSKKIKLFIDSFVAFSFMPIRINL